MSPWQGLLQDMQTLKSFKEGRNQGSLGIDFERLIDQVLGNTMVGDVRKSLRGGRANWVNVPMLGFSACDVSKLCI